MSYGVPGHSHTSATSYPSACSPFWTCCTAQFLRCSTPSFGPTPPPWDDINFVVAFGQVAGLTTALVRPAIRQRRTTMPRTSLAGCWAGRSLSGDSQASATSFPSACSPFWTCCNAQFPRCSTPSFGPTPPPWDDISIVPALGQVAGPTRAAIRQRGTTVHGTSPAGCRDGR